MAALPESARISLDNSKAEYRQLGKSGLGVSVSILGVMSSGDQRWALWVVEEERALPILKAAYDQGLNTWDTTNVYSNGTSEEVIGQAIKQYNIPCQKAVILTKCFGAVGEAPTFRSTGLYKDQPRSEDYKNQYGPPHRTILTVVDASLPCLDTPYIDLLQIYRFGPAVPIEETREALGDLIKSGIVRCIGTSAMQAFQFVMLQPCAEKNGWTNFASMHNHCSLM